MYSSILSKEVPSGAVDMIRNLLLSSIGASSEGISLPMKNIMTKETAIMIRPSQGRRTKFVKERL